MQTFLGIIFIVAPVVAALAPEIKNSYKQSKIK